MQILEVIESVIMVALVIAIGVMVLLSLKMDNLRQKAEAELSKKNKEEAEYKTIKCKDCKNCKMLYRNGLVVCDKLDFKTPTNIPDICNKREELTGTIFDEFDDNIDI